jgi:hypothetical protein
MLLLLCGILIASFKQMSVPGAHLVKLNLESWARYQYFKKNEKIV